MLSVEAFQLETSQSMDTQQSEGKFARIHIEDHCWRNRVKLSGQICLMAEEDVVNDQMVMYFGQSQEVLEP